MKKRTTFGELVAVCCLFAFSCWAQETAATPEANGMEALRAERAADAKALRSALENASTPEQRAAMAAAFVEQDAKKQEQVAELAESRMSALPAAAPVPIEKRFEGIADETVKAALVTRDRTLEELSALRDETKALEPEARAKRYAEWQEKYATTLEATARTLEAETRKEASRQPVAPARPPANLFGKARTAWTQRAALVEELSAMRESTQAMSPEDRSRAYAQWLTQNEGKLEAIRQQLSQEIPRR